MDRHNFYSWITCELYFYMLERKWTFWEICQVEKCSDWTKQTHSQTYYNEHTSKPESNNINSHTVTLLIILTDCIIQFQNKGTNIFLLSTQVLPVRLL